mmetsp:Transcript_30502/g.41320  ORF Transcript_30502/g.41320 Transcript_30502/m.41320 type:complete len:263 (-) Transcript_30502:555-1343(-)
MDSAEEKVRSTRELLLGKHQDFLTSIQRLDLGEEIFKDMKFLKHRLQAKVHTASLMRVKIEGQPEKIKGEPLDKSHGATSFLRTYLSCLASYLATQATCSSLLKTRITKDRSELTLLDQEKREYEMLGVVTYVGQLAQGISSIKTRITDDELALKVMTQEAALAYEGVKSSTEAARTVLDLFSHEDEGVTQSTTSSVNGHGHQQEAMVTGGLHADGNNAPAVPPLVDLILRAHHKSTQVLCSEESAALEAIHSAAATLDLMP